MDEFDEYKPSPGAWELRHDCRITSKFSVVYRPNWEEAIASVKFLRSCLPKGEKVIIRKVR